MARVQLKPGEGLKILLRTVGAERVSEKMAEASASLHLALRDRTGISDERAAPGPDTEASGSVAATPSRG